MAFVIQLCGKYDLIAQGDLAYQTPTLVTMPN